MAVPWWRKAKRKRKRLPVPRKPVLYIEEILRWADAWKARTGDWPGVASGRIPESPGDRWCHVYDALRQGLRGLPPGSTLFKLLVKRRGAVIRHTRFSRFEVTTILAWADAHHQRTGEWPHFNSGPIANVPGETWRAVNAALMHGHRGLPGGSSLAGLLRRERGRPFRQRAPALSVELVLSWADAHFQRTGAWPTETSGVIHEAVGETWIKVRQALNKGHRGLPGGLSLAQLLAQRRGARNDKRLPRFKVSKILKWADAHHQHTGKWPTRYSGAIADAPGETWSAVNAALCKGIRGLRGGSSLAILMAHEHGPHFRHLPRLSEKLILSWADAHFKKTGAWPQGQSGTVEVQPSEKWYSAESALRQGLRGLPGGSSLYQLLLAHGRIKPPSPQGLKRRRMEAGLSRRELAGRLAVPVDTLVTWEQGRTLPTPARGAALARVLRLPVTKLRAEMEAVRKGTAKKKIERRESDNKNQMNIARRALPNAKLKALAAKHKPPQSWYDENDKPF